MLSELYSRYGSRLTSGTSEILYDLIQEDEALAPFFEHVDMDRLREHMADFIGSLTGGPEIYHGRSMQEAHQSYDITPLHYQRIALYLEKALQEVGVMREDIDDILAAVTSLRKDIVNSA